MTTTPQNNLASIQAMRAIAALAVVTCHIGAIEEKYMGRRLLSELGMYGVDVFFVISGFIMTYVATNVVATPKGVARFMLKRALRIYPIYWQFTAVVLLALALKPDMVNLSTEQHSVIKSLLLWPQKVHPHLGVGWSLVYEMYFYLVFAFGLLVLRGRLFYGWCAWVCVLGVYAYLGTSDTSEDAVITVITSPYGLYFLIGCAAAGCWKRSHVNNPSLLLAVAAGWLIVTMLLVMQAYGTIILYLEAVPRVFMLGVPTALILLALLLMEQNGKLKYPRFLLSIGDASYSLYLLHSLLFSAMGKLWLHLHMESVAAQAAYSALMLCTAVVLGLLNYRFIEKPLSRWYHKRLVQ